MGMQIDAATMEDSMEIPLKTRNKTTIQPSNMPLLGIYPEETKTEKDTFTPVFITALFIIALGHESNLDVH